jgi:hypothetical protein
MTLRRWICWSLLVISAWGQPMNSGLTLRIEQGQLTFPSVKSLPSSLEASTAPVLSLEDNRPGGAGYRLEAHFDAPTDAQGDLLLEFVPGIPAVILSPRGATSSSPARVSFEGGRLSPGQSKVLLRADRSMEGDQGRGMWNVSINPRAIRLRVPKGWKDRSYQSTLRFVLYEAP